MKIATWPYEIDGEYKGKGFGFVTMVVTIRRRITKKTGDHGGYQFEEDPEMDGQYHRTWWGPSGEWNEEKRTSLPYAGPLFEPGDTVQVRLTQSEDAKGQVWHNVARMGGAGNRKPTESNGTGSSGSYADKELPETPAPAVAQVQPLEQRILLGMAFNNLTHIVATIPFGTAMDDDEAEWIKPYWEQWNIWFTEASRGLPLSPVTDPLPESYTDTGDYGAMEEAARMDSEAKAVLGKPEPAEDVEDVTHLPW